MPELSSIAPAMRDQLSSVRIAALARRQWGVVSRPQLLACGLSSSTISRWVAAGRLHRLHPGVYAVGHLALTEESHLVAALFYAGTGAGLSHVNAARWWELTTLQSKAIHISTPTYRRPVEGIVFHRPREIEIVRHRRLPVTPLARTLLDFAAVAPERELRKAIAEADYRWGLSPSALLPLLGRGAPGSAALRAAVDSYLPELARTESDLEDDFLFFCERHDLALPLINRRIEGKKVDAWWPQHGVIVELDSVLAHASAPRRLIDRERDLHLRRLGYTVLRYTWHQVRTRPEAVADDLRRVLDAAASTI